MSDIPPHEPTPQDDADRIRLKRLAKLQSSASNSPAPSSSSTPIPASSPKPPAPKPIQQTFSHSCYTEKGRRANSRFSITR
ncbi:hypothetical protein BT96DRAFT_993022 [Gymnopus androsaceus JB14]|uniref:Uncharacterized protein n=1 Tax=Gymnopus androsaceus JB14 TaxID=1447944 RepID=A0A6A4HT74_9AGAR|nr:hypothetical protein BT96DRAFT_993022 [Gymnopus androsaceus JB14]